MQFLVIISFEIILFGSKYQNAHLGPAEKGMKENESMFFMLSGSNLSGWYS
jgi:hypothetical protein